MPETRLPRIFPLGSPLNRGNGAALSGEAVRGYTSGGGGIRTFVGVSPPSSLPRRPGPDRPNSSFAPRPKGPEVLSVGFHPYGSGVPGLNPNLPELPGSLEFSREAHRGLL